MKKIFDSLKSKIKSTFSGGDEEEIEHEEHDYLQIDSEEKDTKAQIVVRPFVVEDFADIKSILDSLREGYTIALVNIKPLKDKDLVELKRAVNKLKKTTDAVDGDIAGFGEDYIVVTPSFAKVYRSKETKKVDKMDVSEEDQEI